MHRYTLFFFISFAELSAVPKEAAHLYVRVRPEVILRESPSIKSRAITKIPFGYLVLFRRIGENQEELLGLKGYWYEVQNGFSDARKGWVFAPLLRENKTDPPLVIIDGKAAEEATQVEEAIYDPNTKLYWISCNAEQAYMAGRCRGASFQEYSSEDGEKYCQNLTLLGLKWRLPSLSELRTIANSNFSKYFPYSELGWYVSSTERSNGSEEYFMSIEIPSRKEHSRALQGDGIIKCFSKK